MYTALPEMQQPIFRDAPITKEAHRSRSQDSCAPTVPLYKLIACTFLRVQHLDSALRHVAVGREEVLALASWADWPHVWSKSRPLLPNCPQWGSPGQRCLRCGGRSCAAGFCSMGWPTAMVERGCPLLLVCPRLLGLWVAPACGMKSARVLPSVFPNVMLGCLPACHNCPNQLRVQANIFEWPSAGWNDQFERDSGTRVLIFA